ncbi:hypothetical protein AHAT_41700 [Agarivorans sp. Toyoura001]|uniref:hypothetical protein n=1 Tax=Agarivorans sp. Toyoura001 TaxID=2283141 RepID=UPI0010EEABC6|nr:hypothetical protein [Agarivorans sp. Toyoura001]GDY28280.1 hypothetical protein AHAT_41700 [Agarivorans sp. Toyoura001]
MRFNQLNLLLEHFVSCREAMQAMYRRLELNADSERVRMLLNYLQHQERENAAHLQAFISQAKPELLDTWTDIRLEQDLLDKVAKLSKPADMTSDDVGSLALELSEQSLGLLRLAKDELTMLGARQFLANLIEHQEKRQQQMVHATHRLDDI